MPTNKLIQPRLNPVKFIPMTPTLLPQHLSRHFDDFFFMETRLPWQQRKQFLQPWQKSDSIRLQFQSNMGPLKLSVIDVDGRVYSSANLSQLQQNIDEPGMYIFQSDTALGAFDEGVYFMRLDCGAAVDGVFPLTLISEPLIILAIQKDTLYLGYRHRHYHGDVAFETGFAPFIRIRATLRLKNLSSKDSFFEDQPMDMTVLESKPFRVYELRIGGASGIPDYLADMLNRILGCSSLTIDGKSYVKSEGAKFEENALENYPMRGWSIELREADNKASHTYLADISAERMTVVAAVDWKGFSNTDQGGSPEQIIEII